MILLCLVPSAPSLFSYLRAGLNPPNFFRLERLTSMSRANKKGYPNSQCFPPDFFTRKRFLQVFEIADALEISKPTASRMVKNGSFGPCMEVQIGDKRKTLKVLSLNVYNFLQGNTNFEPLFPTKPSLPSIEPVSTQSTA